MTALTVAAARVRQGDLTLFATSIRVKNLMREGFYNVETLDPAEGGKGYQRLLNMARARKLADYLVQGQEENDAFLPTSIFLATDKEIYLNEKENTVTIDLAEIGPFNVVDGQHRLEGLRMASEKDKRVLEFEVPVNIAVGLPELAQMSHFLIVNTTQKSVDKSVEQRIISRLTEALDVEDMPSLPRWIKRIVERGEVDKAVKIADFLNQTPGSPWEAKVRMANDINKSATINQRSFVKAIVKYMLTPNNPLSTVNDPDKEKRIILNYWKAIENLLDDGEDSVLYKYNGVELFSRFSIPLFMKLQEVADYRVDTMTALLSDTFENLEGEYGGLGHPEWWEGGGQASRLNSAAVAIAVQALTKALHKGSSGETIKI